MGLKGCEVKGLLNKGYGWPVIGSRERDVPRAPAGDDWVNKPIS